MPDTTPPSAPIVSLVAISSTQIDVHWLAADDDTGVTAYEVWRNGGKIASVDSTTRLYSDKVLAPGNTYSYTVRAFDAAGNWSESTVTREMTFWWPAGYDLPAFRVRRQSTGTNVGGDFVRGSGVTTLPNTAVRYPTRSIILGNLSPTSRGLLFCKAFNYETVEIMWNWPKSIEATWQELALVRSAFGCPIEVTEGQTVFRALRGDFPVGATDGTDQLLPPPLVYDHFPASTIFDSLGNPSPGVIPNGHWYYYTLFFRTNANDWTPMMSDQCLLPKNYGHSNHLWDAVPPYYQWMDDSYTVDEGFLRKYLSIFGFELDRTRGYVEGVLDMHHVDVSPMPLLKHLGANYGFLYEAGIGDVRYRALLANLSNLLQERGTAVGVGELIETVSKYECDISAGENLVLLPDDSNFVTGTGHWAPLHPSTSYASTTPAIPVANYHPYNEVKLTLNTTIVPPPVAPPTTVPGATGTMLVDTADGTLKDIFLTCGDGIRYVSSTEQHEFIPLYAGIPVEPGDAIAVSIRVKMAKPSPIKVYLLPFGPGGKPIDRMNPLAGNPGGPSDTNWYEAKDQAIIPAGVQYVVPALYFSGRISGGVGGRSPRIDIAAVMVYSFASGDAPVAAVSPDRYLTLGDTTEKLGATRTTPTPYEGFILGSPQSTGGATVEQAAGSFFFANNFRSALYTTPTLVDGKTIRMILWRVAPSMDRIDPTWVAATTKAQLEALTGWDQIPTTLTSTFGPLSRTTSGTTQRILLGSAFPFTGLPAPTDIGAISFEFVDGPQAGNLIFTTNTPTGGFVVVQATDAVVANPDSKASNARWLFAWENPPAGVTQVNPIEGPIAISKAAPPFESSNTVHVWLYPQRANMVSNPSFEVASVGTGYWGSTGTMTRVAGDAAPGGGGACGRFVRASGNRVIAETSDWPTRIGDEESENWSFQLMAKGSGKVKVGLVYWDVDYRLTATDWGVLSSEGVINDMGDTEMWTLNPNAWIRIAGVRRGYQAHRALLRIECLGTEMYLDRVLCERGFTTELEYFDGDTKYGGSDAYSWYGGQSRQGATYSLWYGARNPVMGRLFASPVNTNDPTILVDTEVTAGGMVYGWIPAGASVTPHIDVFYPEDQQTPVPTKGAVTPYASTGVDGVLDPWQGTLPSYISGAIGTVRVQGVTGSGHH